MGAGFSHPPPGYRQHLPYRPDSPHLALLQQETTEPESEQILSCEPAFQQSRPASPLL